MIILGHIKSDDNTWIRVLHSELLTELSSRFSSLDEFSRVEMSSEGSDITEIFPKFEKSLFPKLAKTKILEKNV